MDHTCNIQDLLEEIGIEETDLKLKKAIEYDTFVFLLNLKRGDHVAIKNEQDLYWHHGIYVGTNSEDIAIFIDMRGAIITIRPYNEFFDIKGRQVVMIYDGDNDEALEKTANIAIKIAELNISEPIYDLLKGNYESFAAFCRTGKYVEIPETFFPKYNKPLIKKSPPKPFFFI